VDKKIILWSVTLFFGSLILFKGVAEATSGSTKGVQLAVQVGVLVLLIAIVVTVNKRRSKP
jgi:hypothetical protein